MKNVTLFVCDEILLSSDLSLGVDEWWKARKEEWKSDYIGLVDDDTDLVQFAKARHPKAIKIRFQANPA